MLTEYRFPIRQRAKHTPKRVRALQTTRAQERPALGAIRSRPEQLVYWALLELGYRKEDIFVQQPIMGGRDIRGGFVGDIVVYKPHPCLISIKGYYWHSNDEKEFLNDAVLAGEYSEYVVIWDYEIPTYEAAVEVVRMRVGRPL